MAQQQQQKEDTGISPLLKWLGSLGMGVASLFGFDDTPEGYDTPPYAVTPEQPAVYPAPTDTSLGVSDFVDIWGTGYHGKSGGSSPGALLRRTDTAQDIYRYMDTPVPDEAWDAMNSAIETYAGDRGTDPLKMRDALLYTALHESEGWRYTKQIGGGPARSWWQVEPKTAKSLLKDQAPLHGPKFRSKFGDPAELAKLSNKEMGDLLETDPEFAAHMATTKYLATSADRLS